VEFNLADLFECVADQVGDREAVVCGDRRLSYRALDERATRLAHSLAELGVGVGDHVGLQLYDSPEFLEVMLACFKLRAVPINVNWRYSSEELAYLYGDADLVALVYSSGLGSLVSRAGAPRVAIEVGESYEGLVSAAGRAVRDFGPRSPDDHYILYTGGTTGRPKGVVWRQEDIFFAVLGGGNSGGAPITRPSEIAPSVVSNRAMRIGAFLPPGDPGPDQFIQLALSPLMHAGGQWSALTTLLGGGKVVLYPDRHVDMVRVLSIVEQERVGSLNLVGDANGVPLVAALRASPGRFDVSSVRLLGSGGAMLSGDVKSALLEEFPAVLAISEAIGSSEAPVQAASVVTRSGVAPRSLHFSARPETAVFDDAWRRVAPGSGEVGRLATRGRVPLGYYKDLEKSARTFVDVDGARWSLPGDMATVEADGTIRLLGRGGLCINTGGEKVYPEEVEAVLKSHPGVDDAVVVGRSDAQFGERVVAIVQPAPSSSPPSLADLQAHCRGQLAGYKVPRDLQLVDEVVRSPAGKADYHWARNVVARS
jgi:acyl-CoA synthetase (AMP-forming)/AMP-acid ligase II